MINFKLCSLVISVIFIGITSAYGKTMNQCKDQDGKYFLSVKPCGQDEKQKHIEADRQKHIEADRQTQIEAELSQQNYKELNLFSLRSMGMDAVISDIKETQTGGNAEQMIQTGINLNGHLCAKVIKIKPLKINGGYEVTCIAMRGGNAEKTYMLDALKGVASEL